jgi:acyl-coenzyme A thioesterase PaaI-like protein
MNLGDFLAATPEDEGHRFSFGRDLHGAFEGAFGGVVAAACLHTARRTSDRRPIALDCRFLRSIPAGEVTSVPEVVRVGRTLTVVLVRVFDAERELAALGTVSMAESRVLHPLDDAGMVRPGASVTYAEASPWQLRRADAPIVGTLEPRVALTDPGLIATVLRVPFDEPGTGPEASCLAADMAVGPPVAAELKKTWVPHPNPDLSLRFAGDEVGPEVAGVARLERISSGIATVRVEVFSGLDLVAVGISSALLLGLGAVIAPGTRS